ncbi:MAG: Re/Si-specific NAD(P)(+) transhydrogenase subunit alpha [Phycisphaeraceae bacterium]
MKIAVVKQTSEGERRAALVPATVKKLVGQGVQVLVEAGAGLGALHDDSAYEQAGAQIVNSDEPARLLDEADVVVTLHPPTRAQVAAFKDGAVLIGMLAPLANLDIIRALAERGVTAFSMEFVPRISRAQAMDVLSSQANIGGYKAVMLAAEHCPKMFPMMITAAGTLAPARVFVIGAGVAGLQAIATAKRLGAIVEAFDVRAVTKEQVQSLGARFVELPTAQQDDAEAGGYAKEQTEAERRQQQELMVKHVIGADCVIATAAVFGKTPPMLIRADVVSQMRAGSVIVDLAADPAAGRGNCELTQPGKTVTTDHGVTVVGLTNLPALVPVHASQVYANNMLAFLKELVADGDLKLDLQDEIQKGAVITYAGKVVNEMVSNAMGANDE